MRQASRSEQRSGGENSNRAGKRPKIDPLTLENWLYRPASLLSIVLVWLVLARILGEQILPGPVSTFEFLWSQLERGALTRHIGITMYRVLVAFSVAMVLGVVLGMLMGLSRVVDRLMEAWLIVGLTVPRIMLFVVAYLMLGLNDTSAIVALVFTVIPTIIVQLREGTRAVDQKLVEMARAYRRSDFTIWRQVIFPQLLPYFIGTARGALSLAWKMVILAELLGRTSGVGYQITFYFQMFNMRGILAYGVAMMLVLAVIDLTFVGLTQRFGFRWRRSGRYTG
ncbi:MAG: ABC transporter permease [Trueperaceae bacterium]